MKLLQLLCFPFLYAACNNSTNNNQTVKTHADSLMDEVMKDHNIGMAKMSKLNEAKNAVQRALDSISMLSTYHQQKNPAHYKMQLDSAFNRLTYADYAMEKWMNEFNMDSSLNNEEERIKYLESEKIKISKVKDAMISSLQKADSLLKEK